MASQPDPSGLPPSDLPLPGAPASPWPGADASAEPPPLPAEALPVVVTSRACRHCGYDLKSMATDGLCPECGTPVRRSVLAPLLLYASPDYLRTLWTGALLIEAAIIGELVVGMGVAALAIVVSILNSAGTATPSWLGGISMSRVQSGGALLEVIAALGMASGLWLLTTRDESEPEDPDRTTRWCIRIASIVTVLVGGGKAALALFPGLLTTLGLPANLVSGNFSATSLSGLVTSGAVLAAVAVLVALGATIVRYIATMLFFRRLARRVPDEWLGQWASRMLWLGPVLHTVGYAACGMGPLVAMGLYLMIVDRVRRRIATILRSAAAQAPAGPPGPG